MQLRAVQEFIVHIESFRNIDIWYQGGYLLCLQIYTEVTTADKRKEKIYAHPFAFTQHYMAGDTQTIGYDSQLIKPASIDNSSSSFLSKAYLLKYYEEEVQINDICHFRVETDISPHQLDFYLQIDLLFFDQQIKKVDPNQITLEKAKRVKSKQYVLKNSKRGLHQFVPIVFDGQYYSLANVTVHSICLDYRFRMNKIQLFEYSKLTATERKKLLDKNKRMQTREITYLRTIAGQLNMPANSIVLQTIEDLVVKGVKKHYHNLHKQYTTLFFRAITDKEKKYYQQILIHPSQLGLFEDDKVPKSNNWQEQIYKKYKSTVQDQIIEKMINEANMVSGELIKLWYHFVDIIKMSPRMEVAHYETQFYQTMTQFWSNYFRQEPEKTQDICVSSHQNDKRNQYLEKELFLVRQKILAPCDIINQEFNLKKSLFATMVQNTYSKSPLSKPFLEIQDEIMPKIDVSLHLVVLVHGFQGSSLDMKLIKNTMSVLYPETSFLCATSNEDMTDTDIIEMGHRLATEIKNHIIEFFPPDSLQRISFVGHSLGGVIIRAALPRLLQYKDKFHTFMTFSSPHIGYKVNASSVIQAGIWVLQKFKNSNCLRQLTMHDHENPRQTCLYRLSRFEGLAFFKNIFLFSSKQDSYAPYQSARIQIHPDFMNAKDPLKEVHCQMVRSILREVADTVLRRIRVNFTIEQTSIDSLIGRTAHILFLENSQLIQLFLNTHPGLFQ